VNVVAQRDAVDVERRGGHGRLPILDSEWFTDKMRAEGLSSIRPT